MSICVSVTIQCSIKMKTATSLDCKLFCVFNVSSFYGKGQKRTERWIINDSERLKIDGYYVVLV